MNKIITLSIILSLGYLITISPSMKADAVTPAAEIASIQAKLEKGIELTPDEQVKWAVSIIGEIQGTPKSLEGAFKTLNKLQTQRKGQEGLVDSLIIIRDGLVPVINSLIGKIEGSSFLGGTIYKLTYAIPQQYSVKKAALQKKIREYTQRFIKPKVDMLNLLILLAKPPLPTPTNPKPAPAIAIAADV